MTGYGAGRASGPRIAVEVEIRSVNHRGLKVSWRLPPSLTARESEFEGLVRKRVRRGSLAVFLRLTYVRPEDVARVRDDVVAGYAAALDRLRRQRLVDGPLTPEALASLPGALETGTDAPLRPADLKVGRRALEDALSNLDAMRRREATHLVRDLRALARRMDKERTAIARRAPRVVKEHRDRLKERLALAALAAVAARRIGRGSDRRRLGVLLEEMRPVPRKHLRGGGNVLFPQVEVGRRDQPRDVELLLLGERFTLTELCGLLRGRLLGFG